MSDYLAPLIGGILIGLGSLLAMAASGKVPGISGIVARIIRAEPGGTTWRVVFVVGLNGGAAITFAVIPQAKDFTIPGERGLVVYAIAGLLVGFGTRAGGGCTSGHGVCGLGSGAKDGLLYTIVFMVAAAVTVWLWNLVAKGGTAG